MGMYIFGAVCIMVLSICWKKWFQFIDLFTESNWRESGILSAGIWRREITQWTSRRTVEWYDGVTPARSD